MNRIIAPLLILFIFSMHSAWAIGVHVDSSHAVDSPSHLGDTHHKTSTDSNELSDKSCDEHECHISAHVAGVFSMLTLAINNSGQDVDATVDISRYLHSQQTPQRPPKV